MIAEQNKQEEQNLQNSQTQRILARIRRSGMKASEGSELIKPIIKFADSIKEFEELFNLVYNVYSQKGFVPQECDDDLYYSVYSLLPETKHVIAKVDESIVSNMSIVFDSPEFGLPMDEVYFEEVNQLRRQKRRLVEISCLAIPEEHRWQHLFHYLVQVVFWYCVRSNVDDICITVNPRHERFYKSMFGFEDFGERKLCERVCAPAVCLRLDVERSKSTMRTICQHLKIHKKLEQCFYDESRSKVLNIKAEPVSEAFSLIGKAKSQCWYIISYFLARKRESVWKRLSSVQQDLFFRYGMQNGLMRSRV